ncbi:MAG: hypothetical protein GY694_05090 [Gammaproteobacteria bacterium]|nr:hypothetical protein [Gammaproteobacteria bacterium]
MRKFLLLFILFTQLVQANEYDFIKQYIEADLNGERLSGSGLMELVQWEEEPGWDVFTIVSNYSISEKNGEYEVTFVTHGFCPNNKPAKPKNETYLLSTIIIEGKLALKGKYPLFNPHVSSKVSCKQYGCCINGI